MSRERVKRGILADDFGGCLVYMKDDVIAVYLEVKTAAVQTDYQWERKINSHKNTGKRTWLSQVNRGQLILKLKEVYEVVEVCELVDLKV